MSQHARLDNPEVRAHLEATRARLDAMRAQGGGGAAAAAAEPPLRPNPAFSPDAPDGAPPPPSAPLAAAPSGPYAPKFAGALRAPPAALAAAPDAGLPPVGDLFSPEQELPPGLLLSPPPPRFPSWDSSRPALTGAALLDTARRRAAGAPDAGPPPPPLESHPPAAQEELLVDELLHAFDGREGRWVRAYLVEGTGGAALEFRLDPRGRLEPALAEMARRMLPLAARAAVARRFAETRRAHAWGRVAHALAAAARGVLLDWALMLAQLEAQAAAGRLTLQALWYYVQPAAAALSVLAGACAEASARRARGAPLLDLLAARAAAAAGDAAAARLAGRLLRAAAEPYFLMLERWVTEGVVEDPYCEFMVVEDSSITRDALDAEGGAAFWSRRWTLRPAHDARTGLPAPGGAPDAPRFLARVAPAALHAGKCLNLVRSCGQVPARPLPPGERLAYDPDGRFALRIEAAERAAAAGAMALLRAEGRLAPGLAALRRFFLCAQGDLFLTFMDTAEAELGARAGDVPLPALQALLAGAARSSAAAADPFAGALRAAWDHRTMLNMLISLTSSAEAGGAGAGAGAADGADSPAKRPALRPVGPTPMTAAERATTGRARLARESFMLAAQPPWPLALAAPDWALAQYQIAFRHIFELKWVERELNRVAGLLRATGPLAVALRRGGRRRSLGAGSAATAAAALGAPPAAAPLVLACRTSALMGHFFRQYLLYASFEVVEPLAAALEARLAAAASPDDAVRHHREFLRKVMRGLLLSRRVVVVRALLALKDAAGAFVRLASGALLGAAGAAGDEAPLEAGALGAGGGATDPGRREAAARAARAARARTALERALGEPAFGAALADLHARFEARVRDFLAALDEAREAARAERTDTREELESLAARLDYNGYFAG
jgi:gamma-tubulin complex component 2